MSEIFVYRSSRRISNFQRAYDWKMISRWNRQRNDSGTWSRVSRLVGTCRWNPIGSTDSRWTKWRKSDGWTRQVRELSDKNVCNVHRNAQCGLVDKSFSIVTTMEMKFIRKQLVFKTTYTINLSYQRSLIRIYVHLLTKRPYNITST